LARVFARRRAPRGSGRPGLGRRLRRVLLLLGLAAGLLRCARPEPGPPLSILLVTIDTLRADRVGCYGAAAAETPNLDRLAQEGTRFEDARAHVPLTLPSHATILTGLLPPRHGVRGNGLFRLAAEAPTLQSELKAHGYSTAAVVASVVLDHEYGLGRGFDVYDDNQRVGDKTSFNYLERGASQVAASVERILPGLRPPFFLWVHLYDPHRPWVAPEPFRSRHAGDPYAAEIAFADAAFGEIRRAVAARAGTGLVVAAIADHGESLGEHGENQHGYTLHRGVLRVPFLLAGPGVPAGRVVRETVGLVDVAPTLADLGGAVLAKTDGESLARVLSGEAKPRVLNDGAPLWEETLHPLYDSGWAPLRGLLTSEWHLVDAPRPELYSVRSDPEDRSDLSAASADSVRALRDRLAALSTSLGDVPEPKPTLGDEDDAKELREKLASLGYLSSGTSADQNGAPRLDPKDGLPGYLAVEDAEALLAEGKPREAYARLEPFLRADPRNPRIWHSAGKSLLALGRMKEAQRALERAYTLDPRSEFLKYTLADLFRATGDRAALQTQLEGIVRANPRAVEASLELASLALAAADPAGAEATLQAARTAGARDPDLLVALALLLDRRGARGAAARYFLDALELRPDDPTACYEAGRAALRENDPTGAIELLSRCSASARAFECRIELARALVVGPGDLDRARDVLRSAREIATTAAYRRAVDERLTAIEQMTGGSGQSR